MAALRERRESLGVACGEEAVAEAEKAVRVRFPPDYRAFLLEAGGGAGGPGWRGLWRVGEIASLNRHLPVFQWFGGVIGIGNEGFTVTALDYRRGGPPIVVSLGLSSSDEGDVTPEARSFEEWVRDSM